MMMAIICFRLAWDTMRERDATIASDARSVTSASTQFGLSSANEARV